MNPAIDQLAKSILHKDGLEQCSLEELQHLADQYPYFSAVQLLLAKKMREENNELYNSQLQKTSLLFYNPLWLEYLLDDTGNVEVISGETFGQAEFNIIHDNDLANETEESKQANADKMKAENIALSEEKEFEQIHNIEQTGTKPNGIDALVQEENNPSDFEKEKQPETSEINIENIDSSQEKESEPVVEQAEIFSDNDESSIQEEPGPAIELPPFKQEPIDPAKAELTFTPYHTVDYFASQGIKFKVEEKPHDKFSQQLKSFTEWLKILKRTPVSEIVKTTDTNIEQKVEQLAGQSLQDNEVVTETMAEVWEKQGNVDKAIDIYNKLSLHDPSKRAYFAAKIEELKKTI